MSEVQRVWFITGAGRGLGRAFAQAALDAGDRVVGTVRTSGDFGDVVDAHPDDAREAVMDVRDDDAVRAAVDVAVQAFGRLDIVVNNAGLGIVGMVEELSDDEVLDHLDVNLVGALRVTRAALPVLRRQSPTADGLRGQIVQISTTGAVGSMPGLGLYNAGKWGLEGFSEALAGEVSQFGIRVTIAELSGFDTDWAGRSMRFAEPLSAYDELRASLFGSAEVPWPAPEAGTDDANAASTDAAPAVAAEAVLRHVRAEQGPLRLLVGEDSAAQVAAALELRRADYARDPRFEWPPG